MGASPRFGSAFFQVKSHVLTRSTFCYPDSYFEPEDFAVANQVMPLIQQARASNSDLLDDYIEAHIHGVVSIQQDIECIVLDPIYRGSEVNTLAQKLNIPIQWHNGFELDIQTMQQHPEYRGHEYIDLAKEIAVDGRITPDILGSAVTKQGYDEQDIKKIWHYLARFGYIPK